MFTERDGSFAMTATAPAAAAAAAARAVEIQKNEDDSRSQGDDAPQRKAKRYSCVQRSGALDL